MIVNRLLFFLLINNYHNANNRTNRGENAKVGGRSSQSGLPLKLRDRCSVGHLWYLYVSKSVTSTEKVDAWDTNVPSINEHICNLNLVLQLQTYQHITPRDEELDIAFVAEMVEYLERHYKVSDSVLTLGSFPLSGLSLALINYN